MSNNTPNRHRRKSRTTPTTPPTSPPTPLTIHSSPTATTTTTTTTKTSNDWETIISDDFGLFCVKAFLERDLEEIALTIDASASRVEVFDRVKQDKFGRFLTSREFGVWNRYYGLHEWYRTHGFPYDERALFELFLGGEIPVAVLPVNLNSSYYYGDCGVYASEDDDEEEEDGEEGGGDSRNGASSSPRVGEGDSSDGGADVCTASLLGLGFVTSGSQSSQDGDELEHNNNNNRRNSRNSINHRNSTASHNIDSEEHVGQHTSSDDTLPLWDRDTFEQYLIDTSGDTEFPYTKSDPGQRHQEYPFLKDTPITQHLNSGSMTAIPPIQTHNIQVHMQGYDYAIQHIDGHAIGTMTASKLVSIGTVHRLTTGRNKKGKTSLIGHPTSSLLTNIYSVHTTVRNRPTSLPMETITSLRYGTPVRTATKPQHLIQRFQDLVRFAKQIRPRKHPEQPNRICVLSFLDHCDRDRFGQETAVKKKGHEDEILRVELETNYGNSNRSDGITEVVVQQFSASASLRFSVSQGRETSGFRDTLESWCGGVECAKLLLDHVHKKHDCFDSQFGVKLRLKEFIAISMLHYILQMKSDFNFILCYHCMSGKDRTGMFFAIHETVQHFCAGLEKRILDNATQFFPDGAYASQSSETAKAKVWLELFNTLCKLKPTWYETKIKDEKIGYILDKFMRRSILITGASTGWFGLKFGIGIQHKFKKGVNGIIKGLKKQLNNYVGANPIAGLLAPHKKIMDWQLDSQNADS